MKLNWAALVLVALGGVLLVVAWEGTHTQVWDAITGKSNTATNLSTPGAPFTLYGVTYPNVGGAGFGTFGNPPIPNPCAGLTGQALVLCNKNLGV